MSTAAEAPGGEVLLYEAPGGQVRVDVRLDHETVWLTQEQMSKLFGRERSVITKHVRNVFREGELAPETTCAKFAQVQTEGERTVTREIDHYNLDVIISVGYRVKSTQGTRFRQWATRVLREHLVQGYTFNQTRLAERGLLEARQTLDLLARTLVIKDHPFSDGNKRIGSFLFMLYLQQEGMAHQINPQALTALALLIAESAPASKDLMIRLIINLLVERRA